MTMMAVVLATVLTGVYGQDTDDPERLNQEIVRLYQAGRYAEAVPMAEKLVRLNEKALGPEHPNTATNLNNLAELYFSMGDYARAEPLYQRALKIREKALGPEHPDTAGSLNNLAQLVTFQPP